MNQESNQVVGIVVVSHLRLAEELVRTAELIVGPLEACISVSMEPDRDVDEMLKELRRAIKDADRGKGVLILTDLFGGTPANLSLALLGPSVEVVCGVNLPMLIKCAECRRDDNLADAARTVKEYGRRHISLASEVLTRSVEGG